MRELRESVGGRRRFASGQFVPFDGIFNDIWGGGLPLLKGELFPLNPDMGESRWTYAGPISHESQPSSARTIRSRRG
ncbi:hypothetical protein ACFPYJ_22770 [Paenibacillus solisilvae]|uniref:Uncharacterized protein n=1 Tax=Paenibacillus solisilvae TaxID=2486751 RepID=A0ABW0W1L1_9BACL